MIEIYAWDEAPAKYKKLIPTRRNDMSAHTELREPAILAVVPEELIDHWAPDKYDAKPCAVLANDMLDRILGACDRVYDPDFVRVTDGKVLVFGRD